MIFSYRKKVADFLSMNFSCSKKGADYPSMIFSYSKKGAIKRTCTTYCKRERRGHVLWRS